VREIEETLAARLESADDGVSQRSIATEAEELEKLTELIAQRKARHHPPTWRTRVPAILVLVAALGVLSYLFAAGPGHTQIKLSATVDEFGFSSGRSQVLFERQLLRSLGVSVADSVLLPLFSRTKLEDGEETQQVVRSEPVKPQIRLTVIGESEDAGSITFNPLELPPEATVRVVPLESGAVVLHVSDSETGAGAVLSGLIDLEGTAVEAGPGAFGSVGRALEIRGKRLTLTLQPLTGPLAQADRQELAVRQLDFLATERRDRGTRTQVRRVSTISKGTLVLEELEGREIELRRGDHLRFEAVDGWLRGLTSRDGQVEFAFSGSVSGLSVGQPGRFRSLMPTWLEWIRSRQSWVLLWGSALSLIGLILGVLRWLGLVAK